MTEVLPKGEQSKWKERGNWNFHLFLNSRVCKIVECAVETNSPWRLQFWWLCTLCKGREKPCLRLWFM